MPNIILLKTKSDMDIVAEHIETRKNKIYIKNPVSFFYMPNGMLGMKYMLLHTKSDSISVDSGDFLFIADDVKDDIKSYYTQFVNHYNSNSKDDLVIEEFQTDSNDNFESLTTESYPSKLLH